MAAYKQPFVGSVLITCEHGGNRIPARWRKRFEGEEAWLASHRGWDPGALKLAKLLSREFEAPLFQSTTSRLLVELNRSIGHPALFSKATKPLPRAERDLMLERHYFPYRRSVETAIENRVAELGRGEMLLHVSVHTFTPELDGEVRNADVAFLYDPARQGERLIAGGWRAALKVLDPTLRVRMNYPYRGTEDGFTTHLRKRFPASKYAGIELEVNQAIAAGTEKLRRQVAHEISGSLRSAIEA